MVPGTICMADHRYQHRRSGGRRWVGLAQASVFGKSSTSRGTFSVAGANATDDEKALFKRERSGNVVS